MGQCVDHDHARGCLVFVNPLFQEAPRETLAQVARPLPYLLSLLPLLKGCLVDPQEDTFTENFDGRKEINLPL